MYNHMLLFLFAQMTIGPAINKIVSTYRHFYSCVSFFFFLSFFLFLSHFFSLFFFSFFFFNQTNIYLVMTENSDHLIRLGDELNL